MPLLPSKHRGSVAIPCGLLQLFFFWVFGSEGMRSAGCQHASGSLVQIPECRQSSIPTPHSKRRRATINFSNDTQKYQEHFWHFFLLILFPYNLPQKYPQSQTTKALTSTWFSPLWKCFEFARKKFLIANAAKLDSLSIRPNNQVSWKTIMCH